MESIKIKIEKVLIEKGIKKQDFIVKLGMSVSGYYDMIKKNTMTLATLQEISNVLEYPVEYFLPTSDNSYLVAENAKEEP
jgi:DNA-binding Xre family transcriptional regulator